MASSLPVKTFNTPKSEELVALYEGLVKIMGNYDSINLKTNDHLVANSLPDCTLTQHPPFVGLKAEKVIPLAVLQKDFAGALRVISLARHDAHVALHPEGKGICLFATHHVKLRCFPCCNIKTLPVLTVVDAASDGSGVLKISGMHEWAAKDTVEGLKVLLEHCGWPEGTNFSKTLAFGVDS